MNNSPMYKSSFQLHVNVELQVSLLTSEALILPNILTQGPASLIIEWRLLSYERERAEEVNT